MVLLPGPVQVLRIIINPAMQVDFSRIEGVNVCQKRCQQARTISESVR